MKLSSSIITLIFVVGAFEPCQGSGSDTDGVCEDKTCGISSSTGVNDDEVNMLQVSIQNHDRKGAADTETKSETPEAIDPPEQDMEMVQVNDTLDDEKVESQKAAARANATGASVENLEVPSGYTKLDGDCWGNNLLVTEDKSVSECAELCTCNDGCAGFSYLLGSTWKYRCIHKSKACTDVVQVGWTFYTKGSPSKLAPMSCSGKSTPANSDGKVVRRFRRDIPPNVRYLDRHNLACGANSVLAKVQLRSLGGNKIKYNYKCCSLPSGLVGSSVSRTSGKNNDGGGNAYYLDRHNVQCHGSNELMTQVKLSSYGGGKIAYNYKCSKVKLADCSLHSTQANDGGGGNLRYLDRHNIECPAGKGLKRFKMIRVGSKKYRFEYRCCSVSKC